MTRPASSRLAGRRIIAMGLGAVKGTDPRLIAESRWRGDSPVVTRSGVAGTEGADWSVSSQPVEMLLDAVPDTALGRLGVLEVPLRTPILRPDGTLAAQWVAENAGIPAGRLGAVAAPLEPRKIGLIVPIPVAALESSDRRAETMIRNAVRQSLVDAMDRALLDPTNDGTGASPAAITFGAPTVASSGDLRSDLLNAADVFPARLTRSVLVTDGVTALEMPLWTDTSGGARFFDAGPRGGSVATMPLIVSDFCPRDSSGGLLVLVDGARVAAAVEDVEFAFSGETMFEQDSAPGGASDAPNAATATLISTFQSDCVSLRATIRASWSAVLPCVAVITSASYR